MFRTPKKQAVAEGEAHKSPPKTVTLTSNVRRSIGEWEAAGSDKSTVSPLTTRTTQAGPAKEKQRRPTSQDTLDTRQSSASPRTTPKTVYPTRTAEAKYCLITAKQHLTNSRNLKTEIKSGVVTAINRLYALVKELETDLKGKDVEKGDGAKGKQSGKVGDDAGLEQHQKALQAHMTEHIKKLEENSRKMEVLTEALESQRKSMESVTYASVASGNGTRQTAGYRSALHSVVVTSKDEGVTGEEVLEEIRKTADAKEGWITVEKIRKAKDRKVIMGFRTKEEQEKMKSRIEQSGSHLTVETVKNKDPLLMLRDVLSVHTDQEVLKAFRNQNPNFFRGLDREDDRLEIKFRKNARNPHLNHIVVTTSPAIWKRATETGTAHIDLQRVRVSDQSPLIQCSRCLGYGHNKRLCKEATDICSHCGGPHLRGACELWIADAPPSCKNCMTSKLAQVEHNAFSNECPVRRRWDALARMSVAYC